MPWGLDKQARRLGNLRARGATQASLACSRNPRERPGGCTAWCLGGSFVPTLALLRGCTAWCLGASFVQTLALQRRRSGIERERRVERREARDERALSLFRQYYCGQNRCRRREDSTSQPARRQGLTPQAQAELQIHLRAEGKVTPFDGLDAFFQEHWRCGDLAGLGGGGARA